MSDQLRFEDFISECGCYRIKDREGNVTRAFSCSSCIIRALDFLEDMGYVDKVVSVSALSRVEEKNNGVDAGDSERGEEWPTYEEG